jgi:hypothetical protein
MIETDADDLISEFRALDFELQISDFKQRSC